MSGMYASCLVTIRASITPDGVHRLADAIIDKLWPDNRGGVLIMFHKHAVSVLAPLCYEVAQRGVDLTVRATRNGFTIAVEPVEFAVRN